jgi:hypothetical protein
MPAEERATASSDPSGAEPADVGRATQLTMVCALNTFISSSSAFSGERTVVLILKLTRQTLCRLLSEGVSPAMEWLEWFRMCVCAPFLPYLMDRLCT